MVTPITQTISALPVAPDHTTQTPSAFALTAVASVTAQRALPTEINALASQVNVIAGEVDALASAASASAGAAASSETNSAISEALAADSAASALNAPGTNATSATSMTPAKGSISFTLAQTGKAFVVGQWVTISDSVAPATNFAVGPITAFTPGTGAITVDRVMGIGSVGTSWVIAAASAPGISGSLPVTIVAGTAQTAVAGNHYVMANTTAQAAATNLLLYSEQLDNAAWSKVSVTVTANTANGPDGVASMDTLAATAGGAAYTQQVIGTVTAGVNYVVSRYFRASTAASTQLKVFNGAVAVQLCQVTINWVLGVPVLGTTTSVVGTPVITDCGDGLYRIEYVVNTGIYTSIAELVYPSNGVNGQSVITGYAQLELGSAATSYISTTSATVTRSAGVVAPSRLVLPPSAAAGSEVWVTFENGLYTNVVARPSNPELVTNGAFASNITGWANTSSAGGSIAWNAGGWMDLVYTSGVGQATQAVATVIGKTYRVLVGKLGTNMVVNVGTTSGGTELYAGSNNNTDISTTFVATTTTSYLSAARVSAGTATADNISIKEVTTIYRDQQDFLVNAAPLMTWKFKFLNNDWKSI